MTTSLHRTALLFAGAVATLLAPERVNAQHSLPVSSPPGSFFARVRERDREAAREFYTKFIDIHGIPVAASAEVADAALRRTYEIVNHMLTGRPDIRQAMVDRSMYLIIIGKDQVYTDMPEHRHRRNKAFLNERVRGTGGNPTSFGEENLLSLSLDRYDDESIAVHEFCHTIDSALRSIDPDWTKQRDAAYQNAISKGLYKLTYAASNPGEYWAEIAQAYFDCQRVNNWNHGPIGTREQLMVYDPVGYRLCRKTFSLRPTQDWRYSWVQKLPNVIKPPTKFNIDPYYTKFTWAREFTVVGRSASDEALLKANDIIRKMFAYRHDILKALIADGVRLVVLGQHESLADLPELASLQQKDEIDLLSRTLDYRTDTKLLVVGEENVMANPQDPNVGCSQLIRVLANAIHQVAGTREVDPDWNNRGRNLQQYELRVERLDIRFDERLRHLYEMALADGKWQGTMAVHGPANYWAAGVLAYFNAQGQDAAPLDAPHPIVTREALQRYDPQLFAIVNETMAYDGRVDWRLSSDSR